MADQREVIIKVSTDTSAAVADAKELKTGMQEIGNIDTSKSTKTLRQAFKDAQSEASRFAVQVVEAEKQLELLSKSASATPAQIKAMKDRIAELNTSLNTSTKAAGDLKDKFQEFKQKVDSFNPDNKLQGLVSVAQGAVGAVQGVAGAFALVGVESDNAQKIIARLQGLQALSSMLNSVDDIKNGFKNFTAVLETNSVAVKVNAVSTQLATAIVNLFGKSKVAATVATEENTVVTEANAAATEESAVAMETVTAATEATSTAFTLLKGAIIATGIGALIVGITTLVPIITEWISGTKAAEAANRNLENSLKGVNAQLEGETEFIAQNTQKRLQDAKLAGKSLEEQFTIQRQGRLDEYNSMKRDADEKNKLLNDAMKDTKISSENFNKIQEEATKANAALKKKNVEIDLADGDERIRRHKDELNDNVAHYQNLIKIAQANGKDTSALEQQLGKARLAAAAGDATAIKGIEADMEASMDAHSKRLAEAAKEERQKIKDHLAAMQKIIDDARKKELDSRLTPREREINDADASFNDQINATRKQTEAFVRDLQQRYKNHLISTEQFNADKTAAVTKQANVETALEKEKNAQLVEIDKKYNKEIDDFLEQASANSLQKRLDEIKVKFEKLLEAAKNDPNRKALLEALKMEEESKATDQDFTKRVKTVTETATVKTHTENIELKDDSIEELRKKKNANYTADFSSLLAGQVDEITSFKGTQEEKDRLLAEHLLARKQLQVQHSEDIKALDNDEKEGKLQALKAIGDAMGAVGNLFGKQTAANKALNVANALMNTYVGISEIWRAKSTIPEPFGTAAKVAATVTAATSGFSAVKNILAVQVPGGGAGGGNAPAVSQAPIINATQLAPQQVQDVRVTNNPNQQIRAYIVDKDLTKQQQKSDYLNNLSTIH